MPAVAMALLIPAAAAQSSVNLHEPPGPCSRKTPMVISEIMYKPAPRTDTNNLEYLEIYNSNPWLQDISGYQIVGDSMSFTFPPGTILSSNAFLVIAASPGSLTGVYGITNVLGPYPGSLKKSGTIQLLDETGAALLTVPYGSMFPWPMAADGTGHSIVLGWPSYGEGDPRAWDISDVMGGSPGQNEGYVSSSLRNVMIDEFLAHTDLPDVDYIKLYNHSTQSVDISGCILTDDPATNKFVIPATTIIPARGFVSYTGANMNFALSAAGETIYFVNPGRTRVLDAVQFDAQENGVSMGRWPDGANQFYRLAAQRPGTNNAAIRIGPVVINELMYHPISGNDDDQYVELYNRGTNRVDLSGWTLADAISFTFPTNTLLATNGYLVIARNAPRLRANYSNLNLTNCLGDFSGKLSGSGERLALTMPDTVLSTNGNGVTVTNTIHIAVDEVTYQTGGCWGQWSDGGGSSLERIDPHANSRLAANWADSDETQKSAWTNIEATGVLDNGMNYGSSIGYAQIGLLDAGECLVDSVEARSGTGGANLVANSDFESGLGNWSLQGCFIRSSQENSGYSGGHSLHIRCSDRLWTGVNSCQATLNANSLAAGQTATLRFKARWLRGWPEALLRLNGNWLEATGSLPVPANLGTPGLPNSRYVANSGPAVYEVVHSPARPAAGQAVVVTARVHDPDGLQSLTLNYRIDPATTYTAVAMNDAGTGGDAMAGDGLFSATLPGQTVNKIAAFYISATDSNAVTARFPALRSDNAPVREGLVMFGDGNPGGSFGVYHLWISKTNATDWANASELSNETHDGTFVNGNRVIYNMRARFAGSPYHQIFDTPDGALCHYKWLFPDDDKFLGATSFNKIHQPGDSPGDDNSLQREQLANSFLRALGVPWLNRRYVAVYVNGNRRGTLMEDTQCPDGDVVKEHFPNDPDGYLYKMQPWFEFAAAPAGGSIGFVEASWCDAMPFTTTGGVKKPARYRYNFEIRRTPDSASNFTNVFSLVDAAGSYGTSANYVANFQNLADLENWMRVFAANHAAGNEDVFGSAYAQNLYGYIGALGTKYSLLMWDFNEVFDHGRSTPGGDLFLVNGEDPNTAHLYNEPVFRRMYWRALQELVNGPLDVTKSGPLLDAKYNVFVANGLSVESPDANIKPWISAAHDSIASQLAVENTTNFTVNSSVMVSNDVAYVSGTAPVAVKTIWLNGIAWPVTWTSVTNWTVVVPLHAGTNLLNVAGLDMHGQLIPGYTNAASAVYNGPMPSPVGNVVINEIMYQPRVPGSEYVELYNNSSTITFDLSGWECRGLSYTFPAGTIIGPRNFLVLAANTAAFAAAYGATLPVYDVFNGTLQTNGETLSLVTTSNLVVAQVRYRNTAPWPSGAAGAGSSLQMIDPSRDNWRAGNWAGNFPPAALSPDATNSVRTNLPPFAPLWLNELQSDNLTGITNRAGQPAPWVELYNPTTNVVALTNLYLANSYSNLVAWPFPSNAVINPGEFKVIFADGQTNLSTTNELHTSFTLSNVTGSVALSRLYAGQPQVLDFIDYANVGLNHSYGSFPDGQSFSRQEFFYASPGGTNDGTSSPLTIRINEWMAGNTHTLQDPLDGNKYDDWFELYNYGTNAANPAGYYLTHTLTNRFEYQIPSGYTIPPHGFLLVWADKKTSTGSGDLHTNFKLTKSGTSIGLFGADGNAVDFISFGPQTSDISMGLYPDGGAAVFFMPTPTPRTNNIVNNAPPVLPAQSDRILAEWTTLIVTNTATDPDLPANTLMYTLTVTDVLNSRAVTNAAISTNGIITWTPDQTQSPGTNALMTVATDNGLPPLSATNSFYVIVREVNVAPLLGVISSQCVYERSLLTVTNAATEPNIHSVTTGYGLVDPPAGAGIDPNGVFTWTPAPNQSPGANLITTVAINANPYDVVHPQLTATNSFTVTVFPLPWLQDIKTSGHWFSFTLPTLAGRSYQPEYKIDLNDTDWTPLGAPIMGTGAFLVLTNELGDFQQRFFRIRILR
jgi:hypothetical protein